MAQPVSHHLMTLAGFAALPEDNSARYELQEGVLVVAPRPGNHHQEATAELLVRLRRAMPADWTAVTEPDVVVSEQAPPTVRIPDLVVARRPLPDRLLRATDVALVVEIISPGSRNVDLHLKPYEYAEAGIPQYWVVDLDPPASTLTEFTLGAPGEGYVEQPAVSGALRATVDLDGPVELTVDVAALG